jgi:hypothetical protein
MVIFRWSGGGAFTLDALLYAERQACRELSAKYLATGLKLTRKIWGAQAASL